MSLANEGSNMVMPVAPCGTGANGFGGLFGNDSGAWWIILLFVILGGWGNNWGGNRGGGSSGAADNYVLASDFATIQRQLSDGFGTVEKGIDTVRNGLCDGFYTNAQLINGVNMNIMQGTNSLASQLASCCCDIREGISNVKYENAMNTNTLNQAIGNGFCQTNYNNSNNTRDIIASAHSDTDRIMARLDAMENARKDERIAALQNENQGLRFSASQQAQNAYLISQLGYQCPKPAYVVQPPQPVTFPQNVAANCACACG